MGSAGEEGVAAEVADCGVRSAGLVIGAGDAGCWAIAGTTIPPARKSCKTMPCRANALILTISPNALMRVVNRNPEEEVNLEEV